MNRRREQSEVLADLEGDASAVEAEAGEYADAKAAKASAEDDVLEEVLRAVSRALPAVSSKIDTVRGIEISPGFVLLEEGGFWSTGAHLRRGRVLNVDILEHVPLSAIVGVLLVAFRAQRGKLVPRTQQIRREAAILEGVAASFRVGGVR